MANKEGVIMKRIPCLYYPCYFEKNSKKVGTLLDLVSKVNVMTLVYTIKLGLKVRNINVKAQKIDDFILKTFEIVLVSFQVGDKLEKTRLFLETLLLTDTSMEVIPKMLFLIFNNADILFAE